MNLEKSKKTFQPNFIFVHYMNERRMKDESYTDYGREAYFRVYR